MDLQIGSLSIPPLVVCPMAGFTDGAFRAILRRFTSGLIFAEMISVTGLSHQSKGSLRRMYYPEKSRPLGVQLFGSKADLFYCGARYAEDSGVDLVDVNFGCPRVPGDELAGAQLLAHPRLVARIVRQMRRAVEIPVTVKIRAGIDEDHINCVEIAKIAEAEGADGITIHGRTCAQKFRGTADWHWIRDTVSAVKIPVIANGDIDSAEKAREVMAFTGAQGVMVGRAGLGRPWLFCQIGRGLEGKEEGPTPGLEEIRKLVLDHIKLTAQFAGKNYLRWRIHKIASMYFKDLPGAKKLRHQIHQTSSQEEIIQLIQDFSPVIAGGER